MSRVADVVREYHMEPEPLMESIMRAGFSNINLNRKALIIRAS